VALFQLWDRIDLARELEGEQAATTLARKALKATLPRSAPTKPERTKDA
jgi:hypothetical protein